MSIFNQMLRGSTECEPAYANQLQGLAKEVYTPRTFKETIGDQLAYHERKIAELKAVYNSLTPELEKFVEALQKLG
jgi:hypothetical protein